MSLINSSCTVLHIPLKKLVSASIGPKRNILEAVLVKGRRGSLRFTSWSVPKR